MVLAMAGLVSQLIVVQRLRPAPSLMIRAGLGSAMIGFATLWVGDSFGIYLVGLAFLGLGLGLVRPGNAAASSLAVSAEEQGAVAGLLNAVGVTGNIIGPLVGGYLHAIDPGGPVFLNLLLMAGGVVYATIHPRIRTIPQ